MFRFILVFFLIFLSGCVEQNTEKVIEIITQQGKIYLNVEVAETPEEMSKGLMFREKLDEDSGMIFVFKDEKQRNFWMKNTKIPLDMIFVFGNGTINEIKVDVQPCYQDPCEIYPSRYPSRYVVEVKANYTQRKNIKVGDYININ
ncbi:MAG: DUF192 domain-containing protein [Candidatus Aenigmarchaeota archaeon]|nr:DUF192 domain-containing protein [Candidatus Aenigmarchaeota archaeon]